MAKKTDGAKQVKLSSKKKRTSIGGGRRKMGSMNKQRRRGYKPYRGQGKP